MKIYRGCTGDCSQGRRGCECGTGNLETESLYTISLKYLLLTAIIFFTLYVLSN